MTSLNLPASSEINDILSIEMNRQAFSHVNESVIYDLIPHDLSILHYLFNAIPKVKFVSNIFLNERNFKSVSVMEIKNIQCFLNVSLINDIKIRTIKIFCKTKIIEYNDVSDIITIFHFADKNKEEIININFNEPLRESVCFFLHNIGSVFDDNKNINTLVIDSFEKLFNNTTCI
jgi:hypothetical protein